MNARRSIASALGFFLIALSATASEPCEGPGDLRDLPVMELPSHKTGDQFAVMLSGDGGWRRIDKRVTDALRAEGVSVAGFLTPDYFRKRRSPEEAACALERVIRFHQVAWKTEKVILIGYSRGADVLPFMINRLPDDLRASITTIALLGLGRSIDFKYHPSWIPFIHWHEEQYPVAPEVEKLRGTPTLCFFGVKEKGSLCRDIDPTLATAIAEPGSHHFAGNYRGIAEKILAYATRSK